MALGDIQGLEFLNNINSSSITSGLGALGLVILLLGILGGMIFFFFFISKYMTNQKIELHFFEEVNKQMIPTEDLKATELIVPRTNIKVFYIRSKDLYMPRGTRLMGKNSYWYAIRNNREIINFTLNNINDEMKTAGLDYDHTDMRYAYENLREIIKRNYKDKNIKWWQEYKDIISIVVFVFIFTLSFMFLLGKIGSLIESLIPVADKMAEALDRIATLEKVCQGSSGLTTT